MRGRGKTTLAVMVSLGLVMPDLAFPQAAGPGVGQGNQAAPAAAPQAAAPQAAAPSAAPSAAASDPGTQPSETSGGGSTTIVESELNWLITNSVSKDFKAAVAECKGYDEVYRIDCLRQNMQRIANALPDYGEYVKAKRVLANAADKLGGIVDKYADPKAPRLTPPAGANPRFRLNRSYRAVRRDKVRQAMAEATKVVQEAATQLLRSAENSTARLAHYQSISVAVGSTKVLLRSL